MCQIPSLPPSQPASRSLHVSRDADRQRGLARSRGRSVEKGGSEPWFIQHYPVVREIGSLTQVKRASELLVPSPGLAQLLRAGMQKDIGYLTVGTEASQGPQLG